MKNMLQHIDYRIAGAIGTTPGILVNIGWRGTVADFTLVCGAIIALLAVIKGGSELYDRLRKRNEP